MKIFLIALLIPTSSCSILEKGMTKGAELNDDALKGADAIYCKAASIGGISRKMTVKEYLELRRVLCDNVWATE